MQSENHALEVTTEKLSALNFAPVNPRHHEGRNPEIIRHSLKTFGQVEPLVVQKSSLRVIGGNGRLGVMRQMGWTEASIVLLDVDDATALALGIQLNRAAESSRWDEQLLLTTLDEIREFGYDLDGIGWNPDEYEALIDSINAPVDLSPPPADDQSQSPGAMEYRVIIDCQSETDQAATFERLTKEGLKCRLLIS